MVHVDRMRRRYIRDEAQELSQDGVEEQEEASEDDRNRFKESFEIDPEEDTFFDEETKELGRGKRQRQPPLKYSDYVLY